MRCYIDVDENGYITDILAGNNLVIDKEYDYVFDLSEDIDVIELQVKYKIVNGELVEKSPEEIPNEPNDPFIPEPPLTLEELKRQQDVAAMAVMELAQFMMGGIGGE